MTDINFKVNDNGKIINVKYKGENTCEYFMRDFTKKNTNYESVDCNIYLFKVNGRILNNKDGKLLKTPLKDIITEDQIIRFVRKKNTSYSKKN
jgi:hypothetical protein